MYAIGLQEYPHLARSPQWTHQNCLTSSVYELSNAVRGHLSISLLALFFPTFPLFICTPSPHLYIISRDYTQRPTTFTLIVRWLCRSWLPDVVDFPPPHPLLPRQHWTSLGHIRTGPRDTMAPSAITWTPIYRRL
jgi:hypothetical protein